MVICETSEQARRLYEVFQEEWEKHQPKHQIFRLPDGTMLAAEPVIDYKSKYRPLKAASYCMIRRQETVQIVKDFKNMTIDILIVFNMLLTGFDAPV